MSRGWQIVFNIVMLLALLGGVAIVLTVNHFTQFAMLRQDELPSEAFYEDLLNDLKADLVWNLHVVAPGDPDDPALRRYAYLWSAAEPWSNADAPDSLVDGVNKNLRRWVDFQKAEPKRYALNNNLQHPILRDPDGRGSWLMALRAQIVDGDTVVTGVCTPMDALYDFYLPRWFDNYMQHASGGYHLDLVAERFPMQLRVKPRHSSRDTLSLLNGASELVMFDQTYPDDDVQEYNIDTNVLLPGIGWLSIRGPGIMDQMLIVGAKRAYWWLYATWVVLFLGMVYLMARNGRPRIG